MFNSEQSISLSCQVEAYPQPAIVWALKTKTKIQNILNTSRISILTTDLTVEDGRPFSRSQLIINNVNSYDGGDYLCVATAVDRHHTAQSRVHSITVNSKQSTKLHIWQCYRPILPTISVTDRCDHSQFPCFNGATCTNYDQGYSCICSNGYMRENCSQRRSKLKININCIYFIIIMLLYP